MENLIDNVSPLHKAGFVNIIGKPNVGKSTLMNQIVGEKLSIITSKAQTTRHRIMGVLSGDDYQIVYSDTPGILTPKYELHKKMMAFVSESIEDADVVLWIVEIGDEFKEDEPFMDKIKKVAQGEEAKLIIVLNKVDISTQEEISSKIEHWKEKINPHSIVPISALHNFNIDALFALIIESLPFHPPYFPKDTLTDRPERFFAAEIIREKIFLNYSQEIPYSCEVEIERFKESEKLIHINAVIYVEKESQKSIIIGKNGEALKKVGTEARLDLEKFFGKKIFLEQYVKVEKDWRKLENKLRNFGYLS